MKLLFFEKNIEPIFFSKRLQQLLFENHFLEWVKKIIMIHLNYAEKYIDEFKSDME